MNNHTPGTRSPGMRSWIQHAENIEGHYGVITPAYENLASEIAISEDDIDNIYSNVNKLIEDTTSVVNNDGIDFVNKRDFTLTKMNIINQIKRLKRDNWQTIQNTTRPTFSKNERIVELISVNPVKWVLNNSMRTFSSIQAVQQFCAAHPTRSESAIAHKLIIDNTYSGLNSEIEDMEQAKNILSNEKQKSPIIEENR